MIKCMISDVGGYVVGDGNLPNNFSPDAFFEAFANRIIEARAQGLRELELTEDEVWYAIEQTKHATALKIANARRFELPNTALRNQGQRLLNAIQQ